MSRKKAPQATPFQLAYERVLRISMLLLGTFHMLLSFARHYFSPENQIFYSPVVQISVKAEKWFAVALLACAIIYLILLKTRFKDTWFRVKTWFRGLRSVEGILLACLFLYFVFCCYVNSRHYTNIFKANDVFLFDNAVCLFVLFLLPFAVGMKKAKLYVDIMLHTVMLVSTVFIVWALWNLFHLDLKTLPNGLQIGMTEEYRFSPGVNSNIGAAIGMTMVLISLYMIATHRWPIKLVYAVVLLPHLYATLLTNSRGAFLAIIVALPLFVFMTVWENTQKMRVVMRILLGGLAAAVIGVATWLLRNGVFDLFEAVTHLSEYLDNSATVRGVEADPARLKIWRSSVSIMLSGGREFFCGTPFPLIPTQIENNLVKLYGEGSAFAHAHNVILQTGLMAGVPGMLLFLAYLVKILFPCLRVGIGRKVAQFPGSYVLPIAVLAMLVENMVEPFLLYYISVMACLFFLFCGYIVAIDKEEPLR